MKTNWFSFDLARQLLINDIDTRNINYEMEMKLDFQDWTEEILISKSTIKILLFEFHSKPKAFDYSKFLNESTLFWIYEQLYSKFIRKKKGQRIKKSHKDYIS